MGSDFRDKLETMSTRVSIHAPTWGATTHRDAQLFPGDVSIHAPTWGATRRRAEERRREEVSIHAPTWGATSESYYYTGQSQFQSTLPHGERHNNNLFKPLNDSFNPRSHMGSDVVNSHLVRNLVFQSTLPHGERRGSLSMP